MGCVGEKGLGGTECAQWCAANSYYSEDLFGHCTHCLDNQKNHYNPHYGGGSLSGYVSGSMNPQQFHPSAALMWQEV